MSITDKKRVPEAELDRLEKLYRCEGYGTDDFLFADICAELLSLRRSQWKHDRLEAIRRCMFYTIHNNPELTSWDEAELREHAYAVDERIRALSTPPKDSV
jgi:hypothetical protein